MTVDAGQVAWLKRGALFAQSTDAGQDAKWGAEAIETEIVSALAFAGDALVEAARQIGFLAGPLAIETHDVPGLRSDLYGRAVTVQADRLGYEAGLTIFVIGVEEHERVERTTLTVVRRL
jgi:hypothetical protein